MEIKVRNVNHALEEILWKFKTSGVLVNSRNGAVLRIPEPVLTTYTHPTERVLFSQLRDANPFFHLFEALWMLGGYNEVDFPARFAKQIAAYSDDAVTLNGAYGYRWRHHFGHDQIKAALKELRAQNTRRAVIAMWDGIEDLQSAAHGSLDVPCNTHIYFDRPTGALDMTVCCRSNDAVWGAYGANAVHFSVLQQYMAEVLGVPVGVYRQFSNNMHIYADRPDVVRLLDSDGVRYVADDRYTQGHEALSPDIQHTRLIQPQESALAFLADIHRLVWRTGEDCKYATEFFAETVSPMQKAHAQYKSGLCECARNTACEIAAQDWMMACVDWLDRREVARDAKKT